MKIAICISGGMKFPEKSFASIKKIIPNEFVKVFIHTWKVEDESEFKKTSFAFTNPSGCFYESHNVNLEILNQFNCEKLLIENYTDKNIQFKNLFSTLSFTDYPRKDIGPISMWYSIFRANQLKIEYENENNMIFDKIVRMRFDSDFQDKTLNLNNINESLNIPSGRDWGIINDQFSIGDSKTMNIFCNLYNEIRNLQGIIFTSENLLLKHIKNHNLKVNKFDFNIDINNSMGPQISWV